MAGQLAPDRAADPAAVGAQVTWGTYSARLAGDLLVDGQAELRIWHPAGGRAIVRLDPCRLAISEPRWSEDGAAADRTAGKFGVGPDGKLALRVANSGTLRYSWSLRADAGSNDPLAFSFELPPSPSNRLRLTLPAGLMPAVEQGFVAPLPDSDQQPPLPAAKLRLACGRGTSNWAVKAKPWFASKRKIRGARAGR